VEQYGQVMVHDQFIELFDGLLMLYGVEDEEAETVAWVS